MCDSQQLKRGALSSPDNIILPREHGFDTPMVTGRKHSRKDRSGEAGAAAGLAGLHLSAGPLQPVTVASGSPAAALSLP